MKRLAAAGAAALTVSLGCAWFASGVKQTVQEACSLNDTALVQTLVGIAEDFGVPLQYIEQVFSAVCPTFSDPQQAREEGLKAARAAAHAAKANHARFEEPSDGGAP